ncbi:MAG: peptidase [Deltaproteobacteria bacterium]|nr:peptidase [Deltaproteobacteria bacterium]
MKFIYSIYIFFLVPWSIFAMDMKNLLRKFDFYTSEVSIKNLPDSEKKCILKLMETGPYIDKIFLRQNFSKNLEVLEEIKRSKNKELIKLFNIHYGPFDRTDEHRSFFRDYIRPLGGGFYPDDMSKEEFDTFIKVHPEKKDDLTSPFTVVKRDNKNWLYAVFYHKEYEADVKAISKIMLEASELTQNESLKRYLKLRAEALLNDKYFESDIAWLELKDHLLDAVIAPYETYDDMLFGYKAGYEGIILMTDIKATQDIKIFDSYAVELERALPIPDAYKKKNIGAHNPIGVYYVLQYSGQANAGIKSIAASLPNDEKVREQRGAKTIIFRNVIDAKFEKILKPIGKELIDDSQIKYISRDSFFQHALLHELAHPLGANFVVKNNEFSNETVRFALKDKYSTIEEAKADILGLYNLQFFINKKLIKPEEELNAYVTHLASIFRTIRFGASEDHAKGCVIQLYYILENGGILYNEKTRKYSVNLEKFREAVRSLSSLLLTIEATGDYDSASKLIEKMAYIRDIENENLKRLEKIPIDIVFNVKVIK